LLERGAILSAFTEKSDDFARTFVASGTYGFLPGHPSAQTQPLYGFFLVPVYWIFGRTWLAVGLAQIALATVTALLVYAIGRRTAPRVAVLAACLATLNPYLIWHDVHVNREIVDQPLLAALVLATILTVQRTSLRWAAMTGLFGGALILANTRLTALPVVLAGYIALRLPRQRWPAAAIVLVASVLIVTPWVVRNKVSVGCYALTTDGRALWKANNPNTYSTLAHGKWIDDVPQPASFPLSAQDAAKEYRKTGRYTPVDECAQMRRFEHLAIQFVEHHPGAKAKLAGQATWLLWDPRTHETQGRPGRATWRDTARRIVEPVWAIPVFILAAIGLFVARSRMLVELSLIFLAYNTLAAMAFAGTTRYRVPYDFLLALLASVALDRLANRSRYTRSSLSTEPVAEN
jgi:4-amino-4-deoxy-L-arabinose transferase-like glycosyltransferase